ncbi:MAG TPA: hypothetical protein VGO80_03580 [Solirubrobacteraceae bacterium]|nr:hypothetical protein [Solirubrobacteraceae bacterium]
MPIVFDAFAAKAAGQVATARTAKVTSPMAAPAAREAMDGAVVAAVILVTPRSG